MIGLMFKTFGAEEPAGLTGAPRAALWLIALTFVVASLAILVTINFFALFFGVTVSFLGRDGVKFRFLQLFGRVPLIGLTLPVLFAYALWHNVRLAGFAATVAPALLTTVLAVLLLAGIVLANTLFSGARRR